MAISNVVNLVPIEDGFRAKRQAWFLTYPSTPARLSPKAYLSKLPTIIGEDMFKVGLQHYFIAREEHSEPTKHPFHLHVYLKFHIPIETENSRFWDFKFYNEIQHPHDGGAVRNPHRVVGYLTKDPVDWETNMKPKEILPPLLYSALHSEDDWDYYYSLFFQSSMKPGSFGALDASRKLRLMQKHGVRDLEYIEWQHRKVYS